MRPSPPPVPDSGTLSNLVNGGEYAVTGAAVANFTASSMTHDLNDVSAGTLSIVKNGNGTTHDGFHRTDHHGQQGDRADRRDACWLHDRQQQ